MSAMCEFYAITNLPQLNANVLQAVKRVDVRIILELCTNKEEIVYELCCFTELVEQKR
jgi:hypothetical protein